MAINPITLNKKINEIYELINEDSFNLNDYDLEKIVDAVRYAKEDLKQEYVINSLYENVILEETKREVTEKLLIAERIRKLIEADKVENYIKHDK